MADTSAAKRLKLHQLPLRGVSDAALSRWMVKLKDQNILSAVIPGTSRKAVARARERNLFTDAEYGAVFKDVSFEDKDDPTKSWTCEVACPFAMLSLMSKRCPTLQQMFRDSVLRECLPSESSPWGLVWYTDESQPGNVLSLDGHRKVWCVYFSLLQFGAQNLNCADLWFVQGTLRTSCVHGIAGGFATIYSKCMEMFWGGATCLLKDGVRIWLGDEDCMWLFADFEAMLGDERGIKSSWEFKGSSGIKPCFSCLNVVQQRVDGRMRRLSSWCVDIGCTDETKLKSASDTYWFQVADRLSRMHRERCTKKVCRRLNNFLD